MGDAWGLGWRGGCAGAGRRWGCLARAVRSACVVQVSGGWGGSAKRGSGAVSGGAVSGGLRNRACLKGRHAPRRLARVSGWDRRPGAGLRWPAGGGRGCRGLALRGAAGGWPGSRRGGGRSHGARGPRSPTVSGDRQTGRDSAPPAARTYGPWDLDQGCMTWTASAQRAGAA